MISASFWFNLLGSRLMCQHSLRGSTYATCLKGEYFDLMRFTLDWLMLLPLIICTNEHLFFFFQMVSQFLLLHLRRTTWTPDERRRVIFITNKRTKVRFLWNHIFSLATEIHTCNEQVVPSIDCNWLFGCQNEYSVDKCNSPWGPIYRRIWIYLCSTQLHCKTCEIEKFLL